MRFLASTMKKCWLTLSISVASFSSLAADKPNLFVIWCDDVGVHNISKYNHVGQILDEIDKLGIKDNTIVFYSTENGPHLNI